MRVVSLLLLFLASFHLMAQKYNAALIPDSLLKNARVVKRLGEIILEIKSPREATLREHSVYTILDERGEQFANYRSHYDKFTIINSITGILYNSAGKELRRVKKKDLSDESGSDEATLITDMRYKVNNFHFKDYPFTVEYDEEDNFDGIMFFPDWMPQSDSYVAAEYSKYVIIAPRNYEVRYKAFHFNTTPVVTETSDKKIYTWEIRNLPARVPEILSPAWTRMAPSVMLAPSRFERDGYKGDMSTWEDFGKFIYELMKGKDVLPADIKSKVHQLTDGLQDRRQKIDALYNFLQKNTRYIGVQLGIGGWQPFEASYVANKGYGDCKALTNYMIALLGEAGIAGKYVLIRAEEGAMPIVRDFPEAQFNHVICCVPLGKDTVWLECTSQILPPGYLSGFTADRDALLVDETGGRLVHTPKYGLKDNLQVRKIAATLDAGGQLTASVQTHYCGLQQDDKEALINYYSKENVMKYLKTQIELPTYDVISFNYQEVKGSIPAINERLEIIAPNYAQSSGKRLFILTNILNRSSVKLEHMDDRKNDVDLKSEYRDIDTVELKIPPGYSVESAPKDMLLETKFGKYVCSVKFVFDKIIYCRINEAYSGEFPAKDYDSLVKYYEDIYRNDRLQVVLVKKN